MNKQEIKNNIVFLSQDSLLTKPQLSTFKHHEMLDFFKKAKFDNTDESQEIVSLLFDGKEKTALFNCLTEQEETSFNLQEVDKLFLTSKNFIVTLDSEQIYIEVTFEKVNELWRLKSRSSKMENN